jgi:hypothetical protein
MNRDEALRLALKTLEYAGPSWIEARQPAITAIKEALAQTEFIKHEVENADDWSEWVCPDPKNYLMKCCDCGLVHEAQFGVVRYKSETERDDCDMVNDPNLQAVFRMRRSEEWTPEDTAHRVGGLPMAQPEPNYKKALEVWLDKTEWVQETVKPHELGMHRADVLKQRIEEASPQRTWVGLTDEEIKAFDTWHDNREEEIGWVNPSEIVAYIEAKLKEKNSL